MTCRPGGDSFSFSPSPPSLPAFPSHSFSFLFFTFPVSTLSHWRPSLQGLGARPASAPSQLAHLLPCPAQDTVRPHLVTQSEHSGLGLVFSPQSTGWAGMSAATPQGTRPWNLEASTSTSGLADPGPTQGTQRDPGLGFEEPGCVGVLVSRD